MRHRAQTGVIIVVSVFLVVSSPARTQTQSQVPSSVSAKVRKGAAVATRASGLFEVKLTPQVAGDKTEDALLGRMTIDKTFHGDLEASSKGQMLTAMTSVKGSAGYVAIERVSGTLNSRPGTFVLQHSGTMNRGAPELTITVVPDSGTGQLVDLTGKMTIKVADGKHSYVFDYMLPEAP